MADQWRPDLLGAGFEQLALALGEDVEGPVGATLVRRLPAPVPRLLGSFRDVDVLAVHGWSDYFFNVELARWWTDRGARFFALDLRKYGRSLRAGQTPGYVDDLDEYDADIEAALSTMGHAADASPRRRLVLLGHSTGGLTLTLWAARHRDRATALVLNSPWLELQLGAVGRQAIAPLVGVRARFDPHGTHPVVDLGFYTRAQNEIGSIPATGYREQWRPARGFATHPGWLHAVIAGHAAVAAGIDVGCPALVLLSTRSTPPMQWVDQMTSTDSVLVVDEIARAATRIGRRVTIARIDGAIHDVFLSRPQPRTEAFAAMSDWLEGLPRR